MKINKIWVKIIVVVMSFVSVFAGCGTDDQEVVLFLPFDDNVSLYSSVSAVFIDGIDNTGDIVWESSDESVIKIDKGILTAVKTGSATVTASYGSFKQSQKINVVQNEEEPLILADNFTVLNGETVSLDVSLTFEGSKMKNVEFDVSSSEENILQVINGLSVKAKTIGECDINIKAMFYGTEIAQKTVKGTVAANEGIKADKHSYTLYLTENIRGTDFDKTVDVGADVYIDGTLQDGAEVTWISGDPSIASVTETGKLTANKTGKTYIVGTYSADGKTIKTAELPVNVEIPILDAGLNLIVDLTKTMEMPDPNFLLNAGDKDIGQIVDYDSGKVFVEDGDLFQSDIFSVGEHDVIVYNATKTYGVRVNLVAAQYVIRTKEDLDNINRPENRSKYIVLANNIDYDGSYKNYSNKHTDNANYFTGTFNGLGYSIKNIRIGSFISGIFTGSRGSTIKNLGMTVFLDRGNTAALFYWFRESPTVIDNVYLDVIIDRKEINNGYFPENSYVGASAVATFGLNASINLNNCFIKIENTGHKDLNTFCGAVMAYGNYGSALYNNSYVVSSTLKLVGTGNHTNNRFARQYNSVPNVLFENAESFVKAKNKTGSVIDLSGFNRYWDLSGDLPIFKSAK